MALIETQQLRLLERLRAAGEQPVTVAELRGGGIDFPAAVIGELELHGYAIERVYEHGRLLGVRLNKNEISNPPACARVWNVGRMTWLTRASEKPSASRERGVYRATSERVYEHGRLLGVRLNENEISNPLSAEAVGQFRTVVRK